MSFSIRNSSSKRAFGKGSGSTGAAIAADEIAPNPARRRMDRQKRPLDYPPITIAARTT
jgi:hypothetical protein